MKSGIIDDFWSRARYGLQDFNKVAGRAVPNLARCIVESPGAVPNEDFLTNIENAVPIDPTTTLVNAVYQAVNYYATNTDEDCDPFRQSTACLKNFILVLSSGVGADNPPHPSGGAASVYSDATNCGVATYENLTKNSCYGFNNDLRPALWGRQYVSTYIVNTMGALRSDDDPDNPVATTGDILHQAAARGGGEYYESTNANELRPLLIQAFQDILRRAAAGTAASVLASGEGSGANLVQAVFYPRRKFGNTEISWIGRLSNFWYYIDPFFDKSAIRTDDGDHILNVKTDGSHHDYITEMYYDAATETTRGRRWQDTNGDSLKDAQLSPDIEFEGLQTIWEAGSLLWQRNLATSPRMIKTSLGSGLMDFSIAGSGNLRPYLNVATDDEAEAIIRYVHGEDDPTVTSGTTYFYRNRTVSIDVNGNGTIDSGETNVWKLGDVLNSTPKLSSWIPLQQFNRTYRDDTYGNKPLNTGYIYSANYTSRGTIFAGANDGMLHAFKLGTLDDNWVGQGGTEKARITGTGLGSEMWAYIPRSVLPYLKYLKENNYCHIYSVDLTPYIFDASTKRDASVAQPAGCSDSTYWNCTKTQNSWRTIVIGGMRFGGACRETASTCSDCVKAPVADPADAARRSLGYSSYFAIDVTDQNNPQLLWEWDGTVLNASTGKYENRLGFTTTGPAVVKIKARKLRVDGAASEPDNDKNGRWFVVMGSGPTGPISTTDQQFMGRSDQNLRLYVMDLQLGPAALYEIDTGIPYAFAGSLLNANDDVDLDYQDDAVYIPYVRREVPLVGSPTWTKGGVVRLLTKEDMDGTNLSSTGTTALNPSNWTASTVMEDIGPVTSSVARLHNMVKHQHWVYVGEGRYYFEQGANTDDATNQRKIIGFKDPCFTLSGFDYACTTTRSVGDLVNVTNIADVPSNPDASGYNGWYINMDAAGNYAYDEDGTMITRAYRAERVITDPLATTSGVAFFTTYKPYNDECAFGGKSFIWAVKYDTGGAPGDNLRGKGLVQVSTGSIEQVDLSSAFTEGGGRKTGAMEGVPPTSSGLSILSTPPPVKRIMHIRER
jgi:type IV pilus assembly protein PilY1